MSEKPYQPALLIDGGAESLADAVTEVARLVKGKKYLAEMLWPAKGTAAHTHLLDCLNTDRPHKLAPEELIRIACIGREHGCDAVVRFICQESGYEVPKAKNMDEMRTELKTRIADGLDRLNANLDLLKRMDGGQ